MDALGFYDRASWANCEVREKTNKNSNLHSARTLQRSTVEQ